MKLQKNYIKLGTQCASDIDEEFNGTKGGVILIKLKENKEIKNKSLKIILKYTSLFESTKKRIYNGL